MFHIEDAIRTTILCSKSQKAILGAQFIDKYTDEIKTYDTESLNHYDFGAVDFHWLSERASEAIDEFIRDYPKYTDYLNKLAQNRKAIELYFDKHEHDGIAINISKLEKASIRAITKLQRIRLISTEGKISLSEFFGIRIHRLLHRQGFGRVTVDGLIEIEKTIIDILKYTPNVYDYAKNELGVLCILNRDDVTSALPNGSNRNFAIELSEKHGLYLCVAKLQNEEIKAISKIQNFGSLSIGGRLPVCEFLRIDMPSLQAIKSIGKTTIVLGIKLQDRIIAMLQNLEISDVINDPNSFIVQKTTKVLSCDEVESMIIEDFENTVFSLSEQEQDIICSRYGFSTETLTFHELSIKYNLSRERIRQKEIAFRAKFKFISHIEKEDIERLLHTNAGSIIDIFPTLYNCFAKDKDYLELLDCTCGLPNGTWQEIATIDFSTKILNDFFSIQQSPAKLDDVIDEIALQKKCSKIQARYVISELQKREIIAIEDRQVSALSLSVQAAAAQILLSFPNGLPWKEILRLIEARRICDITNIKINSSSSLQINSSDFVFLCNRGEYKHFKYFDYTSEEKEQVFSAILEFMELNQNKASSLLQFMVSTKRSITLDYYTVRYLVRNFGTEYGIHFNGHSSTDTISTEAITSLSSTKSTLFEQISNSDHPSTTTQLIHCIKSRSLVQFYLYINELIKECKIVQINEMTYWVPDKILSQDEVASVMKIVMDTLMSKKMIIEADYFKEIVNAEMNFSYSKSFYATLIKYHANKYGIKSRRLLFSLNEIPHSSVRSILIYLRTKSTPKSELYSILQNTFLSTHLVYSRLIDTYSLTKAISTDE